jgi:hypothetical protein
MAKFFAKLDQNNTVINTCTFSDSFTEADVQSFYNDGYTYKEYKLGDPTFRLRQAMIGGAYVPDADVFTEWNHGFPSWTLDPTKNYIYVAPTPQPLIDVTTHFIQWDEDNLRWHRDEINSIDGLFKDPRVQSYWDLNNNVWIDL